MPLRFAFDYDARLSKRQTVIYALAWVAIFVAVTGPTAYVQAITAHPVFRGGNGTSFRTCGEARALGRAPIYRRQPGYASHLDWDQDGIACEYPLLWPW